MSSPRSITCSAKDGRISYLRGDWREVSGQYIPDVAYVTASNDASVIFNFDGTFISVAGLLESNTTLNNALSYILDGEENSIVESSSADSTVLYASPVLEPGPHSLLMVRNSSTEARLLIQGMVFTTDRSPAKGQVDAGPSTSHSAVVIGGTIGAVIVLGLLVFAGFWLYRRRKGQAAEPGVGPLQVNMPTSEKAFTTDYRGNYGISFVRTTTTSSTDSFTTMPSRSGTRRTQPV